MANTTHQAHQTSRGLLAAYSVTASSCRAGYAPASPLMEEENMRITIKINDPGANSIPHRKGIIIPNRARTIEGGRRILKRELSKYEPERWGYVETEPICYCYTGPITLIQQVHNKS